MSAPGFPTPFALPVSPALQSQAMGRRAFVGGALAGVAAVAAVGFPKLVSAQLRLEKTKITLAVSGRSALAHLPLAVADQLGFFKAEGLEVDISDLETSTRVVQAVGTGAFDVAADWYEQTLISQQQQAKNASVQPMRAFVLQSRAPLVAFGISTRALPGYKTAADLKGRKIGVSESDAIAAGLLAGRMLMRGGLQTSDVSFIGLGGPGAALAALRTGQIDALCHSDPAMTLLEQKSEVKIIGDTRTLKGTADVYGAALACACLIAPEAFIQKNPAVCQALADGMVRALKWLQTAGPGDIVKTVPEAYLMGDRALYLAVFSKMQGTISPDGLLVEEAARATLRAMAGVDAVFLLEKINLAKTYTNDFARRAKERFKA